VPFVPIPLDLQTGFIAGLLLLYVPFASVRTGLRTQGWFGSSGATLRRRLVIPLTTLLGLTWFSGATHHVAMWTWPSGSPLAIAGLALTAFAVVAFVQWLLWATRSDAERQRMWVRRILPSPHEMPEWVALACLAGVAEELGYRGFLFGVIGTASHSLWLGAILSAVSFGAAHFLQGTRGMIGIGVIALLLQALVWATGSLLPAMAVHAAANTLAGLTARRRFPTTGEPPAS
jgi:membrane protease YdiL (CAAX protease family)